MCAAMESCMCVPWASQAALVVKNPPAGAVRNVGWIPGSGGSPEEGMAARSSVLAWRILWTEEPGGPQSVVTEMDTTEAA